MRRVLRGGSQAATVSVAGGDARAGARRGRIEWRLAWSLGGAAWRPGAVPVILRASARGATCPRKGPCPPALRSIAPRTSFQPDAGGHQARHERRSP
jgi:hypothetical protein